MRFACKCRSASSSVVPTGTVMRSFLVMTAPTRRSNRFSKRRSRLVRMPTSPVSLVTGTPEMREPRHQLECVADSCVGRDGDRSTIIPDSLRLTRSTSSAWRSTLMLRWMTPIPPCLASDTARRDSVTVSMAALTIGTVSEMPRVRRGSCPPPWARSRCRPEGGERRRTSALGRAVP